MKKILYIEDEQDQIMMIQELLQAKGYEFVSANDGEEGLRKAQKQKPDLILLDHFLPKIKGFEVCRRLKERAETKDIPVIIISASGVKYVDDQCRDVGADDYIKKPYELDELLAKIKMRLKELE